MGLDGDITYAALHKSVSIGGVDLPVDEDMKMLLTISHSTVHAGIALCITLQ